MIEKDFKIIETTIRGWLLAASEDGDSTNKRDYSHVENIIEFIEKIEVGSFYHITSNKIQYHGFFKEISLDTESEELNIVLFYVSSNNIDGFNTRFNKSGIPEHIYDFDEVSNIDRTIFNSICKTRISSFFKTFSELKLSWGSVACVYEEKSLGSILDNIKVSEEENGIVKEHTEDKTIEPVKEIEKTEKVEEAKSIDLPIDKTENNQKTIFELICEIFKLLIK